MIVTVFDYAPELSQNLVLLLLGAMAGLLGAVALIYFARKAVRSV